ncbi:hypothetical protein Pfo_028746 [Paulownia fortunei]|nr:hypothetical protein Pfo_028746 [Paulownia fortunei]
MAERKLHAIIVAFSLQGHITPFSNLALKLASNGCTITFVHTEFIHHMLSKAHHDGTVEEVDFFSGARNLGKVIDFIPGVHSIKSKDLMSYLKDEDITTIIHQIVIDAFEQVQYADFILINTVNELEHETVLALNQKQPTYAIGPINFSTDFTKTVVPKSLRSETDCTEWLNSKPPGSVLYVSFGSLAQSNKQLTEEIAHGLLLSEVNFVWVLREDADVLPDEHKNDMRDPGLIVSWCNQNVVISNPAIGGFLTHCGWNSILESIWCGVPMICSPFFGDQPTNRKLVVDDWKIGINLCDGTSVDRKEVADKIKQLMSGEMSNGLRHEIKKIRTIVHKALAEDGSTQRNFDQFLKDLRAKVNATSPQCNFHFALCIWAPESIDRINGKHDEIMWGFKTCVMWAQAYVVRPELCYAPVSC